MIYSESKTSVNLQSCKPPGSWSTNSRNVSGNTVTIPLTSAVLFSSKEMELKERRIR